MRRHNMRMLPSLLMLLMLSGKVFPSDILLTSTMDANGTGYVRMMQGNPATWLIGIRNGMAPTEKRIAGGSGPSFGALAMHYEGKRMYWHHRPVNTIMSVSLNQSNVGGGLMRYGVPCSDQVLGLAIDWVAENLYFTDAIYNMIMMISIKNSQMFKIIIDSGLRTPHGIAVHPQSSQLFWTDSEAITLERSTLSGGSRELLTGSNMERPTALVVDNDWLYWLDTGRGVIEKMSVYNRDRRVILTDSRLQSVIGFDVYDRYIFAQSGTAALYIYTNTEPSTQLFNINRTNVSSCMDVVMYGPDKQPQLPNPCSSAPCHHMCVGSMNNTVADCQCHFHHDDMLETFCIPALNKRLPSPQFLFSNGSHLLKILAWCPDEESLVPSSAGALADMVALTAIFPNSALYFVQNNRMLTIPLETPHSQRTLIHGVLSDVKGITIDWLCNTLYWTDATHRHIMIAQTDGRYAMTLKDGLPGLPQGIAVSPKHRKLFWAVSGSNGQGSIWYSYTDGSNGNILVSENVVSPGGLVIDHEEDRLYWTDEESRVIESVNLMGSARHTLQVTARPHSLTVFQDYVGWTSKESGKSGVYWNRKSESVSTRYIPYGTSMGDITIFWQAQQPSGTGQCSTDNGGCSQMCLPGAVRRVCRCGLGFMLLDDGSTCSSVSAPLQDNFFLVSDSFHKQIYQVADNGSTRAIPIESENPVALDFHPIEGRLYWSDVMLHEIRSARLDGSENTLIKRLPGTVIDGLAVDYVRDFIYYTDAQLDRIMVMDISGENVQELITSHLQQPRAIVLDIINRKMYWTDVAEDPTSDYVAKIECASAVDGSRRDVLVASQLKWPNALTIDFTASKMFWADAYLDKVETSDLDGGNRRVLLSHPDRHYFALTHDEDFLYITDWSERMITRYNRQNGITDELGPSKFQKLNAIKLYRSHSAIATTAITTTTATNTATAPTIITRTATEPSTATTTSAVAKFTRVKKPRLWVDLSSPRYTEKPAIESDDTHSKPGTILITGIVLIIIAVVIISCGIIGVLYYKRIRSERATSENADTDSLNPIMQYSELENSAFNNDVYDSSHHWGSFQTDESK